MTITYKDNLKLIINHFKNAEILIGHNIIAYDLPVLAKLVFKCPVKKLYDTWEIHDTLVMSRALDPDRDGKRHSLADWGRRMGGEQKVEHESWDTWDPNLVTRCESDVRLTEKVYNELIKEVNQYARFT